MPRRRQVVGGALEGVGAGLSNIANLLLRDDLQRRRDEAQYDLQRRRDEEDATRRQQSRRELAVLQEQLQQLDEAAGERPSGVRPGSS